MNTNANIVASFEDKYGETRLIHANRHGLCVKRRTDTPCQILSKAISGYVGERVRELRNARGMTAEELCLRAGLCTGGTAKHRIYEIEKNKRAIGVRFGTVYQLAIALEVEISALLPSVAHIQTITGAKLRVTTQFNPPQISS